MALAVAAVLALLPEPGAWWQSLLALLAVVATGAAVVVIGAAVLRMPELRWALGKEN